MELIDHIYQCYVTSSQRGTSVLPICEPGDRYRETLKSFDWVVSHVPKDGKTYLVEIILSENEQTGLTYGLNQPRVFHLHNLMEVRHA